MIEHALLVATLLGSASAPEATPAPTRVALSSFLQDDVAKAPRWTGSVNVGATFTDGNTETMSAAAGFDAERRGENDRWTVKSHWNYAQQTVDGDSQITTRNVGASGKYDYFATEKMYYLGNVGAESDTLAGLDLRYYAGGGVGYQFRETEKMKLSGEAGLVYFAEEFSDNSDDSYISARGAYTYFNQLTATAVLEQTAEVFPSIQDTEDIYTKLDTRLKLTLTKSMYAQLQHVWDWDNTPAPGAKSSDHRVILGVGWSF